MLLLKCLFLLDVIMAFELLSYYKLVCEYIFAGILGIYLIFSVFLKVF